MLKICCCPLAGTMAPFNFTQRASSRTAIKMQPEDLKMDKLDLSTPTAPSSTFPKDAQMQAPGSRFGGKMSQSHGTFEPSKAFVRQLAAKSDYRCVRKKRPLSMTAGGADRAFGLMHPQCYHWCFAISLITEPLGTHERYKQQTRSVKASSLLVCALRLIVRFVASAITSLI